MTLIEGRILTPERTLAETLADLLTGAEYARLAVGYLFAGGLAPVIEPLGRVARVDLLIGNVVNRLTEEQILEDAATRSTAAVDHEGEAFARTMREQRDRAATLTALNLRRTLESLPKSEETKRLVPEMARMIAEGSLHVRLLSDRRLHAKVSLVGYPLGHPRHPGVAIVGSSNITLAADRYLTPQPNIDIELAGADNFRILTEWFDSHWSAAQDFQKELFEELGRCWPLG